MAGERRSTIESEEEYDYVYENIPMTRPSRDILQTFDNPHPGRDYTIEIV